jgi:hypothetical protein
MIHLTVKFKIWKTTISSTTTLKIKIIYNIEVRTYPRF